MTPPSRSQRPVALPDIHQHADTLGTILWNYGADVRGPFVDRYQRTTVVVSVTAHLPGHTFPAATEVVLREVWEPAASDRYARVAYVYDLIDRAQQRRRAFHAHDVPQFIAEFDVVTHEHCEETLGAPACEHYFGLPVDAYAAIQRLMVAWGRPEPLGCNDLRCMA